MCVCVECDAPDQGFSFLEEERDNDEVTTFSQTQTNTYVHTKVPYARLPQFTCFFFSPYFSLVFYNIVVPVFFIPLPFFFYFVVVESTSADTKKKLNS